jgi:hypothetical protein
LAEIRSLKRAQNAKLAVNRHYKTRRNLRFGYFLRYWPTRNYFRHFLHLPWQQMLFLSKWEHYHCFMRKYSTAIVFINSPPLIWRLFHPLIIKDYWNRNYRTGSTKSFPDFKATPVSFASYRPCIEFRGLLSAFTASRRIRRRTLAYGLGYFRWRRQHY